MLTKSLFNLFKKKRKHSHQSLIDCPRCLGKGHVDIHDIKRLQKELHWLPGPCAYCNGAKKVASTFVTKIAADEGYLTVDLSKKERKKLINKNTNALSRAQDHNIAIDYFSRQIIEFHTIDQLSIDEIASYYLHKDPNQSIAVEKRKQELVRYITKVLESKGHTLE